MISLLAKEVVEDFTRCGEGRRELRSGKERGVVCCFHGDVDDYNQFCRHDKENHANCISFFRSHVKLVSL